MPTVTTPLTAAMLRIVGDEAHAFDAEVDKRCPNGMPAMPGITAHRRRGQAAAAGVRLDNRLT